MKTLSRFGPGLLVTAAFVGPGTVTTASAAGARFGTALLWVLLFSVVATVVLQEMSARLGLVTRRGLGEALRGAFVRPWARRSAMVLVVGAIGVGNAAYQTGNILGAAAGLELLVGLPRPVWIGAVAVVAVACLWGGRYQVLERLLIGLVCLMSVAFVAAAWMVRPEWGPLLRGMFVPRLPAGALVTAVALIGTTVVPYNLFLHASAVREKWRADVPLPAALAQARIDTVLSIALGGAVTLAILVTAAGAFPPGSALESAADMARQLEPLLGRHAKWIFAVGLCAAGLTSAITAPLAAAYACSGAFGWSQDWRDGRFRAVWAGVLGAGVVLALLGGSPLQAIIFAQAANGILLPVVAVFLLWVANRESLMGQRRNGPVANALAAVVVLGVSGLGVWKLVTIIW